MRIAFTGEPGVGKSAIAEQVVIHLFRHMPVIHRRFATPIYESLSLALGVNTKVIEDIKDGARGPHQQLAIRKALQTMGDALKALYGEHYLITTLFKKLSEAGDHVIVSDLRLPAEAEALRKAGFYIVMVEAPDSFKKPTPAHITESSFDDIECDFAIYNDRSKTPYEYAKEVIDYLNKRG